MIDNWTRQRRGEDFMDEGSVEERGTFHLKNNTKLEILVVFCNVRGPADGDEDEAIMDRYISLRNNTRGHGFADRWQ